MTFNDLLLEVLHLFFVREFDFVNMNSVNLRTHSFCIKLINVYDLNRRIRFRKYINLRYVFDWCSFVWLVYKSVHFQLYNNSRRQFIWCCIIKIVNDIRNYVKLNEINILENNSCLIRNIRFENIKYCKFFYRTNMMKKQTRLTWTLNEKIVIDRIYSVFNNVFHAMF